MSSSFRTEYRYRHPGYRSPSPPRDAYEGLSDSSLPSTSIPSKSSVSRKKRKLYQDHSDGYNATHQVNGVNGWDNASHDGTREQSESRFQHKRMVTDHHFHASQSPLDVFATVATSPDLRGDAFLQHDQWAGDVKPLIASQIYSSHESNGHRHQYHLPNGSSRHVMVNSSPYAAAFTQIATSQSLQPLGTNAAMEDAELLLSFAKAVQPKAVDLQQPKLGYLPSMSSSNLSHQKTLDTLPPMSTTPVPIQPSLPIPEDDTSQDYKIEDMKARMSVDTDVQLQDLTGGELRDGNVEKLEYDAPEIQACNSPASPQPATSVPRSSKDQQIGLQNNDYNGEGEIVSTALPPASLTVVNGYPILQSQANGTQQSNNISAAAQEPPPRVYKGWPKGKPRGPRQVPYAKRGTRRANKQASMLLKTVSDGGSTLNVGGIEGMFFEGNPSAPEGRLTSSYQTLEEGENLPNHELHRRLSLDCHRPPRTEAINCGEIQRSRSVPPSVLMTIRPAARAQIRSARSGAVVQKPTESKSILCASCNSAKNGTNRYSDVWIACNACEKWYHHTCVGFKTERQTRDVDKFHCKACEPVHGPTTFVRKSSRAHASVDYAGLNEGKIRTATDIPDHHYIKAFVDGTIQFQPETFPRMRPELVTADYFRKCSSFSEPVVIPAWMNRRTPLAGPDYRNLDEGAGYGHVSFAGTANSEFFSSDFEYDCVPDNSQDSLDMVIPRGLTVRAVTELYGPDEKVEVIDVKSQEGEDKRWNMRQWADYYEATGEKPVRNVISLEVSQSKLGRLIQRPKVVRDLDLQDDVWPEDEVSKAPSVQFYCLMSVANCFTDFHIDFGGSSVYYHIIKGKKTFFFIPPKKQHLKKYEEWCRSADQGSTWLGDETKECYRVDLSDGDTMLIPSGWIHAVWTPVDTLVIGGNFLTHMHYSMQLQINDIEKTTGVARKFRYPQFQKVLWYAVIKYLERDPVPSTVAQILLDGGMYERRQPIYLEFDRDGTARPDEPEVHNARYYSEGELEGLSDLLRFIFRTVLISLGKIAGIAKTTQDAVTRSLPKGYGNHLEIAQTFAIWVAWKQGNEELPSWAYPDAVIAEEEFINGDKKISAAAIRRKERQAAHEVFVQGASRRSSVRQAPKDPADPLDDFSASIDTDRSIPMPTVSDMSALAIQTINTNVKRQSCDACRKRRIRCRHGETTETQVELKERFGIKHIPSFINPTTLDEGFDEVAFKDEIISPLQEAPPGCTTLVAVVINSVAHHSEGTASAVGSENNDQFEQPMQNTVPPTSISSNEHEIDSSAASRRARTRACDECRKSKRRCIHDADGHIDPVKAQEAPVTRGPQSAKRSRTDAEHPRSSHKKIKQDPDTAMEVAAESSAINTPFESEAKCLETISAQAVLHDIDSIAGGTTMLTQSPEIGLKPPHHWDTSNHGEAPSPPRGENFNPVETISTGFDQEQLKVEWAPDKEAANSSDFLIYDPSYPSVAVTADESLNASGTSPHDADEAATATLYRPDLPDLDLDSLGPQDDLSESDLPDQLAHNIIIPTTEKKIQEHQSTITTNGLWKVNRFGSVRTSTTDINIDDELACELTLTPTGDSRRGSRIAMLGTSPHVAKPKLQNTSTASTSESLPSTPSMSPLTDLGHSPRSRSPRSPIHFEHSSFVKADVAPILRQTPRQRKQVDRFADSVPATTQSLPNTAKKRKHSQAPPQSHRVNHQQPRKGPSPKGHNHENNFVKPAASAGRKHMASRSASKEAPGALPEIINEVKTEATLREEEDVKLARELSGLDFGLRRRSR